MRTTVLATSLILALTACSEKNKPKNKEEPKKLEVTVPASETSQDTKGGSPQGASKQDTSDVQVKVDDQIVVEADALADAGEQLVGPYTFMLADKVFDSALAADPNNKKAQFYKAFLKRLMVFKGIATRIRPITRQEGNIKELNRLTAEVPNAPLKTFLLDGKEDLKSIRDVMSFIGEYKRALNDFRKFTKANLTLELTLNLNPHVFQQEISKQMSENCEVVQNPDQSYQVKCDYLTAAQKKINSADMLALSQSTSGELLMWSLYTAYDVTNLVRLSNDMSYQAKSPEQQLEVLKNLPSLARLRKDQTLSLIPEMGADFSAAMKWALQYQKNLCPHGAETSKRNRPGHLFNEGLCVEDMNETQKTLAILDQVLTGPISQPITKENGEVAGEIRVDAMAFLKNPPKDLKLLLPSAVNEKGDVTEFGSDKTLGGLLPDGDADRLTNK